ncbi:hypothetical protein H5410_040013 [Solanum commersonii]|uniref:Uncharacterized protein n=1 Tax=Solanum commersonii TaxID=4109 RepID=A0A9J5XMM5_SOLCO|nr:hypothetical protein H5410_040013 [Solanum commersonii]
MYLEFLALIRNNTEDMSRLSVWGGPSASVFPIGNEKVFSSIWHSRRKAHFTRKTIRSCAADFKVLTSVTSNYNNIVILDTPESRVLLLDSSNNVHSILHKGTKWTGAYWDEFASLPAIVPKGPLAIFGLGGATAAHLILELWPSLLLVGWEIDEIVVTSHCHFLAFSFQEHICILIFLMQSFSGRIKRNIAMIIEIQNVNRSKVPFQQIHKMIQLNWPLMYSGIELSQNHNTHVSIIEIPFGFSSIFGSPWLFYRIVTIISGVVRIFTRKRCSAVGSLKGHLKEALTAGTASITQYSQ